MRFGVISPPVPGHIHPFGALGRELIERGHSVTFFHMADVEERVRAEGLEFVAIGQSDHPPGTLARSLAELRKRKGLPALLFTVEAVGRTTEMMLRDAPRAIERAGVSMLLVDQMEPAGGAIAEHLGIPFVTICNALMLNREPDVPPPFSPWSYRAAWWARWRNRLGYAVSDMIMGPVLRRVKRQRRQWGLKPLGSPDDSWSRLAQISQLPALFDFPRRSLPPEFHYTGPLRKPASRTVPFPWERMDGRPLIYASLGTLQGRRPDVFRCFAEAAAQAGAQIVIAHGGGLSEEEAARMPGDAVVVNYAPQTELIARARLTLTHAGLNTILDSLTYGAPAIAVPLTYEQPAIAARLCRVGAGASLPLSRLSAGTLRPLIARALEEGSPMRTAAARLAKSIEEGGGVRAAADVIESRRRGSEPRL